MRRRTLLKATAAGLGGLVMVLNPRRGFDLDAYRVQTTALDQALPTTGQAGRVALIEHAYLPVPEYRAMPGRALAGALAEAHERAGLAAFYAGETNLAAMLAGSAVWYADEAHNPDQLAHCATLYAAVQADEGNGQAGLVNLSRVDADALSFYALAHVATARAVSLSVMGASADAAGSELRMAAVRLRQAEAAGEQPPTWATPWHLANTRGRVAKNLGAWNDARAAFRDCPDHPQVQLEVAEVAHELGDYDQAAEYAAQALPGLLQLPTPRDVRRWRLLAQTVPSGDARTRLLLLNHTIPAAKLR